MPIHKQTSKKPVFFSSFKCKCIKVGQGSHRPGKVLEFDLGPGKLLEFQNSAICPGIVLEFCKIALENVKLSLKIIKYTDSFPFFGIYVMRERKLCENRWIR